MVSSWLIVRLCIIFVVYSFSLWISLRVLKKFVKVKVKDLSFGKAVIVSLILLLIGIVFSIICLGVALFFVSALQVTSFFLMVILAVLECIALMFAYVQVLKIAYRIEGKKMGLVLLVHMLFFIVLGYIVSLIIYLIGSGLYFFAPRSYCEGESQVNLFEETTGSMGCVSYNITCQAGGKDAFWFNVDYLNRCSFNQTVYLFEANDGNRNAYKVAHIPKLPVSTVLCWPFTIEPNERREEWYILFALNVSLSNLTITSWYTAKDAPESDIECFNLSILAKNKSTVNQ